jgi:hypothetical protein
MMLEAVRQTAYDLVKCEFVFDFEKPIDIKQLIRDCADYHYELNDGKPLDAMWVHASHPNGFDNLDIETFRLELVRVYKRLIDLYNLGAFDTPDEPAYIPYDEPMYKPIV